MQQDEEAKIALTLFKAKPTVHRFSNFLTSRTYQAWDNHTQAGFVSDILLWTPPKLYPQIARTAISNTLPKVNLTKNRGGYYNLITEALDFLSVIQDEPTIFPFPNIVLATGMESNYSGKEASLIFNRNAVVEYDPNREPCLGIKYRETNGNEYLMPANYYKHYRQLILLCEIILKNKNVSREIKSLTAKALENFKRTEKSFSAPMIEDYSPNFTIHQELET